MKFAYLAAVLALLLVGGSALAQPPSHCYTILPDACFEPCPYPVYPWFSAEYLFWAVREQKLARPLVTTSLSGTGGGILGDPDTVVLVDSKDIDLDGISGARLSGGVYDARLNLIVEGAIFGFPEVTERTFNASDESGFPVLARPFFDSEFLEESSFLIAFPNAFSGQVSVEANHRLFGAEFNLGCPVCGDEDCSLDFLVGLRYLQLEESLGVEDTTTVLADGIAFFLGEEINEGDVRVRSDLFRTRNKFFGGQVGFRSEARCGLLFVKLSAFMAVGQTDGVLDIRGKSTLIQGGVVTNKAAGGLLALPTNSGHFHADDVIAIPQVELSVGVQVTECFRVFVGYGFVYWTDVVRPSDQIPTAINPNLVPTSPSFGEGGSNTPAPVTDQSNYWLHGLHAGVAVRF